MAAYPEESPPRLAAAMWKRFALAGLIVFMLTAASTATAVLLEVKGAADAFNEFSAPLDLGEGEEGEEDVLADVKPGDPQTILVLGSDRRYIDIKQKNAVRSDTIILIRLDPSKGATSIMSLPRDLKVDIPGGGTDKINAAYAIGGPRLTVKTVRKLLSEAAPDGSFPIHHVVNVNFGGFQRAVNRLGCVYVDIDRKYFNDNSPPNGGGPNYAVIDVPAGYQRMCGQDALDYVRYRHFDSDLVRGARQQDFLRSAKDQIGVGKLFSDRDELLKIFARYTQTDIRGTTAILRLIKLAVESARNPIQEIQFPGEITGDFVETSPERLKRAVTRFLDAQASPGARGKTESSGSGKKRSKGSSAGLPPGMTMAKTQGEDQAIRLDLKLNFPVYFPKAIVNGSSYQSNDSRAYDIFDRNRKKFRAYRIVVRTNEVGQYYGVQGTTWKAPPLLDNPSERRRIRGRTFELFFDGNRLRLVAWRTKKATYWVSNTLLHRLKNRQMLALASSLSRIGEK